MFCFYFPPPMQACYSLSSAQTHCFSDFGHAETVSFAKKRVVLRHENFWSIVSPIKLQRKRTFEKLGAFNGTVFC